MSIYNDLPSTQQSDEQIKQMQNAEAQEAPAQVETAQLDGVGKWFEENVAIPVIDTLDQSRDADEVADDRTEAREGRQELDQYITDNPTILSETGTAVLGGAAQVVETGLNAVDLAGDALGGVAAATGIIERDSSDIPWSESYEWANYDLGIAENQTTVGKFGREIVAVLGGMAALGGAGVGVGAGKSIASRLGSEALRGGLYDFFANPGEGNLSNLVQSGPLANPLSKALAHEDEDNPWIRKLKNMVEGGTIGIAVDGLQEVYGALRAGTKASADAKAAGASPEEAAQAGTDAAIAYSQTSLDLGYVAPRPERPTMAYDVAPEVLNLDASNVSKLNGTELKKLETEYDAFSFDPDIQDEVIRNADPEAAMEAFGRNITVKELPNGTKIDWIQTKVEAGDIGSMDLDAAMEGMANLPPEAQAMLRELGESRKALMSQLSEQNVVRIDWDSNGGDLGNSGTKLYSQFGEIAKEQKPGTIIQAEAAGDGFGSKGTSESQSKSGADSTSIREKLYKRAGLSEPDDSGQMYGIVKYRPDGRRTMVPLDSTKPIQEQVDAAKEVPVQGNLELGDTSAVAGPTRMSTRKVENDLNSGRPDGTKPPTLDPQDRVSQTYKDPDINSSAASFYDSTVEGAGRSLVDEIDVQNIKTTEGLREFISTKLPEVDVDEISRRLSRQTPEHVQDTFRSLAEFANSGEMSALDPMRFKNTFDVKGVDAGGAVVLDTLVKSMGERVSLLSKEIAELTELNAPFKTQARQLLDRAEGLVTIKKEATQFASKGLENWKQVPNQLKRAVEKDREEITKMFSELREGLESTDPEKVLEFKDKMAKLGMGLSASKGDPRLQMSIFEGIARVGFGRVNSIYINSLLSGPLTHARNISGNLVAIAERPLSRAIGGGGGKSFAAFDGIYSTITESIGVARKSLDSPYSVTTSSSKVADYAAQDRKVLQNALDLAQTDGERTVAGVALQAYDLTNNPWYNWPGKALQAGDDLTKSLLARMEIRYQAAIEADEIAKAGDPRELKQIKEDVYHRLASEKLSPGGAVLDHDLIDTVDAAAFQRPLQGNIARMGKAIQDAPGGRIILPFYKTGVNISRYGLQMSPLAPLSSEFRQVMKHGSAAEKQVMRGRMALGFTITGASVSLASAGLMTGYGPPYGHPDYDTWHSDHEPMSIKVGDKWVSYQALPGMSLVMSAVADMTMMGGELSDGNLSYVLGAIPYFIANAVTSQPMFQGVTNLAGILDTQNWTPEKIVGQMGQFANNAFVGGGSLRRSLEHSLTENMSDYRNEAGSFISGHKIIGTLSGGLLGEKVERINILTGKPMPTKYSNKLNLINPFTVVGKDRAPVLDSLEALDFPIKLAIPNKIAGVNLTPDEKNLFGKAMYAEGKFPQALQAVLAQKTFWKKYEAWQQERRAGDATPKEDSAWYGDLKRIVAKYQANARREVRYGTSETSQNYRDTFATRASKLSTGSGGGLSPKDQDTLREINDLQRWGSGQKEQN